MESIIVALITGAASVLAVIITNSASNNKIHQEQAVQQARTDEKISELTREVRAHNGFAERIPVIEEKISVINNRIKDLEAYHK
ncbi:MAG: hypothetical protein IKY90_01950 [Oscillospiraceae bacterium]|nr:hypothetical protein [Oscillospiraceae bacterium]